MGVIDGRPRATGLIVTANSDDGTTAEVLQGFAYSESDAGVTTDDGGQSEVESVIAPANDGLRSGQIRFGIRRSQLRRMTRTRTPAVPLLTQPKVNSHSSTKKFRRYENQLELLKECDETEQQEVSIEDLVVGSSTSRTFTKMLKQENMLDLWNRYLDGEQPFQDRACKESPKKNHNNRNQENQIKFDPDEAFQNICRKLRSFIRQRHFPLGVMENLEEDLIGFFCNGTNQGEENSGQENAEYLSVPLDSFRRAVIHALCMYSSLHASSIKCKEKTDNVNAKQVRVQPSSLPFQPPSPRLSEYLETKFHNPKRNVI